jgi:DNA-binding response OmpR family regulator
MTKSILVVENEPLIAMDLEDMLRSAGYADVSHVVSIKEAFGWLGSQLPEVAILDLLVRDGPTTAVAQHLRRAGAPFLVYSGLAPADIEGTPVFNDAVWLSKPCRQIDLLLAIEKTLGLATR